MPCISHRHGDSLRPEAHNSEFKAVLEDITLFFLHCYHGINEILPLFVVPLLYIFLSGNSTPFPRLDLSKPPTRMEEELVGMQRITNTPDQGLPPGFRFHPTDEELLSFYLASKVFESNYCGVAIAEVNLNKCEPWDLPEMAKLGEREWYLYNLRDKKYPTSLRTDRATRCGYWKSTGKDKKVFRSSGGGLLGIQKTLVFYKGRAPRGEKTSWVMHEYRLAAATVSLRPSFKAEWVMCKIFNKVTSQKATSSSTTNLLPSLPDQSCMPPMPDSQTQALQQTFQYPLHIHRRERDPRSLTRLHNQQSQIFTIPQSSPDVFDSLLFCQDPAIPQLSKTGAINFSNFQPPDNIVGTLRSMDNFKPIIDYYQHPATDAGVPDVST